MRLSRRIASFLAVLTAPGLAGGGGAWGQLAAKSPFLPAAGAAAAAAPAADQPLEFRGYMETSEGTRYRIYDPAKKTGIWVMLNQADREFGVTAKRHDPEQNTLELEFQGRALTLAMRKPKIVSSGSAPQVLPAPAGAQANVPPAVTQAVVLNPTPADEQRRLDAVAAEVARRRALREQAAQQLQPGAAASPAAPQVMPAPAQINVAPGTTQNYVSPTTQFGTEGRRIDPGGPR